MYRILTSGQDLVSGRPWYQILTSERESGGITPRDRILTSGRDLGGDRRQYQILTSEWESGGSSPLYRILKRLIKFVYRIWAAMGLCTKS